MLSHVQGCATRPAPDLTGGHPLNYPDSLTLTKLRGKIVVLDFWTYSCVNCLKIILPMKKLQQKFADDVVFLSVHSPKYASEKPDKMVQAAMRRYNITNPVINDPENKIWTKYGVGSWPTFVVIGIDGQIVREFTGDRSLTALKTQLETLVKSARVSGKLKQERILPKPLAFESKPGLCGPGKIAADPQHQRLFVTNTGKNQVLEIELVGRDKSKANVRIIGDSRGGFSDGSFKDCRFNHPEGLAVYGNTVYVADADNHAIRAIDLESKTVSTVVGNGQAQNSRDTLEFSFKKARLDTPWDLLVLNGKIYIAMAGAHQIWSLDPEAQKLSRLAGTGTEDLLDGSSHEAALAQPSSLASDGQNIYFTDSESNSIRLIDLSKNKISTLIGKGMSFCGDKDGVCRDALLTHPEGIAFANNSLFVADSFNNKVKRIDLTNKLVCTLAGSGLAGNEDGDFPSFNQPAGLALMNGVLYVADRNNDQIRCIDLARNCATTLNLSWEPHATDNSERKASRK